ncbi:uncharacterized protein LOC142352200 isoform X3 [Convolutriloba macropyga]|uniref:uncharacterized protein LOC142352200 isoform X3 n=1 Tax=Convolutriloba macropyga TaxID=536237 RepID=UPI003F5237A0
MAPQTTLADLIDMSLGTPEVGAVNFNILHSLLHQLLKEVGLGDKAAAPIDTSVLKSAAANATAPPTTQPDGKDGTDGKTTSTPYHAMISRINQLESRLKVLDHPDQKQVNEDTMIIKEHGGKGVKPVSDMWTLVQTQRRSQSNEEMITKLSSMMEDLLSAHQRAKADNELLKSKITSFNSLAEELIKQTEELKKRVDELEKKEANDRVDIDELKKRMQSAQENLEAINKRMEGIPTDFSVFALKKDVENNFASKEDLDREMMRVMGLLDKKASQDDMLEVQEKLRNIPNDLVEQLDQMNKNLESLRLDRDSYGSIQNVHEDAETLASLQNSFGIMQNEVEKLQSQCQFLMDEGKATRKSVIEVDARVQTLDMIKADKETIQIEIDLKADKRALDSKIGRTLFDEKTGEIDEEIGKLKLRLGGAEDDYRKALDELLKKLDAKLDKDELGPLKEWLENKLKGLKPKLIKQEYRLDATFDADDAAGFRKPLSKAFCISCDRSLDVAPAYPIPTFPSYNPLPPSRSARPYTTYELDQIRQAQRLLEKLDEFCCCEQPSIRNNIKRPKSARGLSSPTPAHHENSMHQDPDTVIHPYNRPAGGTYTTTTNKRMAKAQQIAQMIEAEETANSAAPEVELMGIDGRIYKGRTGESGGMIPGVVHDYDIGRAPSAAGVELPDIQQRSGRRSAVMKSAKRSSARGQVSQQQKQKPSTPASEVHPAAALIDPSLINNPNMSSQNNLADSSNDVISARIDVEPQPIV